MKDLSSNPLVNANTLGDTYPPKDTVPTLGELIVCGQFGAQNTNLSASDGSNLTTGSTTAQTGHMKFLIAPFPLMITAGWFSFYATGSGTITASNTNYWTFTLSKTFASGTFSGALVSATSQSSGGNALGLNMSANTPYSWNGFQWSDTQRTFAAGDILGFNIARTGTPNTAPYGIVTVTVAYRPV